MCSLKNILEISASIVLKTLLNRIVGIGCTSVIFHSDKPTGSINKLYQLAAVSWPARVQFLKQYEKLYIYNTIGDVAMTPNISQETNYFHNFLVGSIQNKSSSPFLCFGCVLSMFLNFVYFSAPRSYKWILIKK